VPNFNWETIMSNSAVLQFVVNAFSEIRDYHEDQVVSNAIGYIINLDGEKVDSCSLRFLDDDIELVHGLFADTPADKKMAFSITNCESSQHVSDDETVWDNYRAEVVDVTYFDKPNTGLSDKLRKKFAPKK
jgi:hypothetical protein